MNGTFVDEMESLPLPKRGAMIFAGSPALITILIQ
jgi:hypothetical protein